MSDDGRWRAKPGGRVRVVDTKLDKAIPGIYLLIDRSPNGWWAKPADQSARDHAERFPNEFISGCIELTNARIHPVTGMR